MNIIALTGNAVRDVELKYNQGGTAIGSGTIAVRRDFKNKQTDEYETDFINFTTFGKQAEVMANHIRKGDKFGINGRLQIRTWENDQGQRQYFTEVVVSGFDFPDKKREPGQAPQQNYQQQSNDPFSNNSGPIEVDDDMLPF
ncbi:single-stranded DNA-binding protein [Sporosarcina highlanderae]|uniref:Single-stranded DNA-binding protein n=1 Tax=Sporosarcina highlanderae TaxID=3035916 RepID=A0ABT8JVI0_9BACL|nr:single-stranded DNA-binding protein [Sporosarcina highlanderae]MDN4609150.1 single-stranded DNA-binding protein [Sporosarcina highlanderae]